MSPCYQGGQSHPSDMSGSLWPAPNTVLSLFILHAPCQHQVMFSIFFRQICLAPMDRSTPNALPPQNNRRSCEITILSFSRSICHGELAALIGVTGKPYPSCLSCHSHPIRPCGHLPLEGNAIKLRKSLATQPLASSFGGSAEGNMCKPFGQLPRWGAKNVLPLNLIALP